MTLVPDPTALRFVYPMAGGTGWARLDTSGTLLASVTTPPQQWLNFIERQRPAVAFGGDTLVLVAARSVLRLGPTGEPLTPPRRVLQETDVYAHPMFMARRGPDAVLGWSARGQLRLMRLAP